MQPPPRQKTAEEERARAAARQAEKEAWERNRGAGSAVFKLAEAGRIKPKVPRKHYNSHYHHGYEKAGNGVASHDRVKEEPETQPNGTEESNTASSSMSVDSWTAQDVLPSLEEVEKKLYEPVYVPSADVLLSRGICDYTLLPKTLGRGKFSTVFVASKFGELHAIKHTALFPHHQLIATRLLREPTLLAELPPHPNLVSVKETIRTPDHFYLVEEYLSGYVTLEALMPMLNPKPPHILPIPAAEKILAQLLSAVRAIHVPLQICHRDIKPENILVHPQTLQLKLLDFGLATHFSKSEPKLSTCCGSPAFHSPEIVKSLASPPGTVVYMGPEVDAWTVGVTMLRCMTGARFPLGATHSSLRGMSIRAQRALAGISDISLRERIGRLLDMDAKKRMASFEEMVVEQERTFGEPDRSAKRFKSTTFISSAPTHSIRLPLIDSTNVYDPSSHMVQSGLATPTSASRRTTPSNSRAPSPSRLPPAATSVVQGTTLTALNPTSQSPERVISFVKYCLRCAGILYHTWPDTSGISKTNKHGYLGSHASQPTTYVSAAFAEAVGSPLDASTAPSTPLLPPTFTGFEDRHDGYAHVQVFQCVIELPEEKEDPTMSAMGQLGQLSLVQSIMAAFSRKPAPSNQANLAAAPNSSANRPPVASTTTPRPRMEGKRSLSTPATPRAKTTASVNAVGAGKASSGNGSTRCLAFHLIVKFPSHQQQLQSMVRQAVSRASSYFGAVAPPLQEEQTQQQQAHRSLRSRASSASGVLSSDLADSFGIEKRLPSQHKRGGSPTMDLLRPSVSRNHDGFAPATKAVEVTGESPSTPTARPANRSPSASRPHSQTRKRSSRGYQKRPKVYFHVTDDRAVHAIREALSIGGTVDPFELEEMSRTGHSSHAAQASGLVGHEAEGNGTVNGNHAQGGTRRTARRKTRDLSTLQINTPWPSAQSDTSSTPVSPTVNREDRGFSRDSASENEDTPRGRSMASSRERFSGNSRSSSDNVGRQHDVEKGVNDGYTSARAPSQLSSLAVKEESPANDGFSQTIDSLAHTLNQIVSGVSSSSTSPSARSSPSSPQSEQEPVKQQQIEKILNGLDSVKMTYEGRQAGLLTQARSQLLEISRILHRAARKEANVLQDTISPISFNLFSALSPALGLIPTETLGLPASSTVLNEAHGGATTLRGLAMSSFEIFAQHASPREIFLAAQERIEFLGSNQQLEVCGCRTEREKLHRNSRHNSDDPVDFKQLESPWSSALEMAGLLHILCISVHRLKTQKPVSFVEPLMDLIPRTAQSVLRAAIELPRTGDDDNATVLKPQGIEAWRRDLSACEIGLGIVALCRNVGQWAAGLGNKVEEDVKRTLLTLLYSSVIVVLPHIPKLQGGDSLAHAYFIQLMPQYNVVRPSTESVTVTAHDPLPTVEFLREDFWTQIRALIDLWNVDVEEQALQRQSRHEAESATATQTVGAFKLLVNLLAQDAKNLHRPPQWPAKDALTKLQRSLGLMVASLGSGPPAALSKDGSRSLGGLTLLPDVALTWALWCVENARNGDRDEGQDPAEMLLTSEEAILFVHTLSTYAALSPRPDARQISLYVVRRTLSSLVEASMAHELMYEIMSQSPYPQLRAAFVGLARSLIVAELDDEQTQQSSRRFAVAGFVNLLEPKVLALPQECARLLDDADDEVVRTSMRACMDDNAAWLSECLSFVYLIVCKDRKKGKEILSSTTLQNINVNLLAPLDKLIVRLRQLAGDPSVQSTKAVEANIEFDMILSMLDVGLQRAREAVTSASAPTGT